jgi:hypothetical protein
MPESRVDLVDLGTHLDAFTRAFAEGRMIPVFGPGANLCGRRPGETFQPGQNLPERAELAGYLARGAGLSHRPDFDLNRIAQEIDVRFGGQRLAELLSAAYSPSGRPTPLHLLFARLAGASSRRGALVILSANYDDALERALAESDVPFDLLSYIAHGEHRDRFLHRPHGGKAQVITRPNAYRGLDPGRSVVVLKTSGTVNAFHPELGGCAITEDDLIAYLATGNLLASVPAWLAAALRRDQLLFLGYDPTDWGLRVIWRRVWGDDRRPRARGWAIVPQAGASESRLTFESRFWTESGIRVVATSLEEYVAALEGRS